MDASTHSESGKNEVVSVMRATTRKSKYEINHPAKNIADQKDRIRKRRGCLVWMPVLFCNDLVHGSWYYVIGSALGTIIPIFPLIGIYEHYWHKAGFLSDSNNAIAYAILVVMGIFYTVGSWAFLRAVEEPPKPPLFTWYHFSNDELFAMWMFTFGTVPSIPCVGLYMYYNPHDAEFRLAFILCLIFSVATFLLTLACYPSVGRHKKPTKILAKLMCTCFCKQSWYGFHFANDWLIAMWVVVVGCVFSCFAAFFMLCYYIWNFDAREVFNFSTGLVDCILFLIGSLYLLAGSYPVKEVKEQAIKDLENNEDNSMKSNHFNDDIANPIQTADTVEMKPIQKKPIAPPPPPPKPNTSPRKPAHNKNDSDDDDEIEQKEDNSNENNINLNDIYNNNDYIPTI
eukprot:gene12919-17314_t